MKKKILLLLLCMLMIVPLFVVGASADASVAITENVWDQEQLSTNETDFLKYGNYHIEWKIETGGTNAPDTSNAYAGASWQNPNSVSFMGSKLLSDPGSQPYVRAPMMLAITDLCYNGVSGLSHVYYSDYFRFKWYMTQDGLCTLAVYGEVASDTPIMVVNIGLDITLFMDDGDYCINYCHTEPIYIDFYFEMAYVDYINVQYNPAYRGGFECFMNCFATAVPYMDFDGDVTQNIDIPGVVAQAHAGGYELGYKVGHEDGHVAGWNDHVALNDGMGLMIATIFEAPYRFLASFFDVNIFGINLFNIISSIISIALLVLCVTLIVKVVGHFKS